MENTEKQFNTLTTGTIQVLPEQDFKKRLESGTPLKIKFGADPTAPDLHLGHAVALSKLRQFQDLGHHVIFLIGDFTARIGDPSGRSKTRPALSNKEIAENSETYFNQVSKILDPEKTTIRYNSEWLGEINLAQMVQLAGKVTLARLIEREDFQKRLHENVSIGFHELFYPIFQGYDSVALEADVEIGGTDQTFNLLMGRHLQEHYNQEPQVIMTLPLLEGLDGVQKMSKSYGNYIGLWEEASQAYGKLMSISDDLMWRYFYLLLYKTQHEIAQMKAGVEQQTLHPMELKKKMAHDIIQRFWSFEEAEQAQANFENLFQKQDYTQAQEIVLPNALNNPLWIVTLLKELGAISSTSEGKRLIEGKAVSIDGEIVSDFKAEIKYVSGMIIKVGKHRIFKIK